MSIASSIKAFWLGAANAVQSDRLSASGTIMAPPPLAVMLTSFGASLPFILFKISVALLLGICFWREGLEAAFGPELRGEKGG